MNINNLAEVIERPVNESNLNVQSILFENKCSIPTQQIHT